MAEREHWVNLTRDNRWVKDEVKSIDHVGPVRFEAKFSKAKYQPFKFRVVAVGNKLDYTASEKRRNANFRLRDTRAQSNQGKKQIKDTYEANLAAAGGVKYKIEGKAHKMNVKAGDRILVARRRLFYQTMKMTGIAVPTLSDMEDAFWKPDADAYIKLKKDGPEGILPLQKTLDFSHWSALNNEFDALKQNAKGVGRSPT